MSEFYRVFGLREENNISNIHSLLQDHTIIILFYNGDF